MRIVVAPDKFKGSLTAAQAAESIARGLAIALPDAQLTQVPVADGGDGTAATLVHTLGGGMRTVRVRGPNGAPVVASYGTLEGSSTAVVELAAASGLALVPGGRNDALTASTYGTGELIGAAIDAGITTIILAIGGSATNDAGTGALHALGCRFLDASGNELPAGGAALSKLARIDTRALDQRLRGISIIIASDVRNPLCGPSGASAVYGPQKGAAPADVATLDAALRHFADVVVKTTGSDVRDVPGAGAAGGAGAGFLSLAGAVLRPGAQLVLELLDFDRFLEGAQLVLTGEGRIDRQTLAGKAPFAVAQAAYARGIPTIALAGSVDVTLSDLEEAAIVCALPIVTGPMTLDEAMQNARELLINAATMIGRTVALLGGVWGAPSPRRQ